MNKQRLHITLVQCAKIRSNNSSYEKADSGQMLLSNFWACEKTKKETVPQTDQALNVFWLFFFMKTSLPLHVIFAAKPLCPVL